MLPPVMIYHTGWRILKTESPGYAALQPGKTYVHIRIFSAQELGQRGRHNVFRGEMPALDQVEPQLCAVQPLMVLDLSGEYAIFRLIRQVRCYGVFVNCGMVQCDAINAQFRSPGLTF